MGLMGSAFGRGLASAAGGASETMTKYIDEELLAQRARTMADLQRTSQQNTRLDEDAFRNDPARLERDRANRRTDAVAAGDVAREVQTRALQDRPLIDLARQKAADDAKSLHKTQTELMIGDAANPDYLKSMTTVKLADPEIKARIEASRAQAAQAYSAAAENSEQTKGLAALRKDMERLDTIYTDMATAVGSKVLTDEGRAKTLADLERQAYLIKAKRSPTTGRDPELDTQTVVQETTDEAGNTTKTTRKEVRRPGGVEKPTSSDPIKAAMDAARAARNGGGAAASSGGPMTRKDPITGAELTEQEWDRKFGRGDFKKLYKSGEDSLKSF